MKKLLKMAVLMLLNYFSMGQVLAASCVEVTNGTRFTFELRSPENYLNCFGFQGVENASYVQVLSVSPHKLPHHVRLLSLSSAGALSLLAESNSNSDGIAGISLQPQGRNIVVAVHPDEGPGVNRNVAVSYSRVGNVLNVVVEIGDVKPGSNTPPPSDCVRTGKCYDDQLAPASPLGAPTCSAGQKAPPGKSARFNTNQHLGRIRSIATAINSFPFEREHLRALAITSMFFSNRIYDLKNNANYQSSQEFGNWFFGAAAAEMGYSEQAALKGGAVVQQWQNFSDPNNAANQNLSTLAQGLLTAITTGQGDNPDDPPMISAGYKYAKEVFDADPNRDKVSDSCDQSVSAPTLKETERHAPVGGGWIGSEWRGPASCSGECTRFRTYFIWTGPVLVQRPF